MSDDGSTKDDVKVPDGEAGDKINKLFKEDEKDTNVIILTAMGEEACIDAKEVSISIVVYADDRQLTFVTGSKGLSSSKYRSAAIHPLRGRLLEKELEHYSRLHVL